MAEKRCEHKCGEWNCGSYQFNLYKDDIDQGNLCDVHYWQIKAQRPWVGLTDGEWVNIVNKHDAWFRKRPDEVAAEVAKLVEAKLKERNHG